MRIAFAGLVLGALLSGAALAEPAADSNEPIVEKKTGLIFPAQIGKFRRTGTAVYPDPRDGIGIRYDGPGRAEAFVYDMGYGEIPTGVDSEAVTKAFAQSRAAVERLLTQAPATNGKKFAESTPVVETEGRVAKVRVAVYSWTYTAPDGTAGPMATWVFVTAFKNQILKLLYTSPAMDPLAAQGDVKELIYAWLDANPKERQNFLVEKKKP
jgi:hypothetical protein